MKELDICVVHGSIRGNAQRYSGSKSAKKTQSKGFFLSIIEEEKLHFINTERSYLIFNKP